MKRIIALLLIVFSIAPVFAGGSSEAETTSVETVFIEHALGTVEVPVNPAKVAVFSYDILDVMSQLGIEVAAVPKSNVPAYLQSYVEGDEVIDAGTLFEPDYEALYNAEVDVIFISDRQAAIYDELSKVAPVIYTTIDPASYRNSIATNWSIVGEVFGKSAEAQAAIDETVAAFDAVGSSSSDIRALFVLVNDGSISAYGIGSRFGFLHSDFGFAAADDNIEVSRHGQSATFEYIASVDPDVLFVMDRGAAITGVYTAASVLDNDIIANTTAAKNGSIVYIDSQAWYLSPGGILSTQAIIADVMSVLED